MFNTCLAFLSTKIENQSYVEKQTELTSISEMAISLKMCN